MKRSHLRLDKLVAIVDYNKVIVKDFIWESMWIESITETWRTFCWNALEVSGHNIQKVALAVYRARWVVPSGPLARIIACTVKGEGIQQTEFNYKWHTHAANPETADVMLREISLRYRYAEEWYSRLQETSEKELLYAGSTV